MVLGPVESFPLPAPPAWYGLLPDMSYSWRVRGSPAPARVWEDDPSWGAWSDAWTFRTPKVSASSIVLTEPADAALAGTTPVLVWQDADPSVWYYEVQVSRDPFFGASAPLYWELRHGGATDPPRGYNVPADRPLEPGATYYWRVRPRVQGDGTPLEWSRSSRFTTASQTRVTLADNGKTVSLQAGDLVELDLGTSYQWSVNVEDPKVLEQLPTMGVRAMPALFRAAAVGQTALRATGNLPCHQATPPCLAPSLLFEIQVRVGPRLVEDLAPIESASVRKAGSEYILDVVAGLPSGCVQPGRNALSREGPVVRVRVLNLVPADPVVACTLIYGKNVRAISLGTDFTAGAEYTVLVNDRSIRFVAT